MNKDLTTLQQKVEDLYRQLVETAHHLEASCQKEGKEVHPLIQDLAARHQASAEPAKGGLKNLAKDKLATIKAGAAGAVGLLKEKGGEQSQGLKEKAADVFNDVREKVVDVKEDVQEKVEDVKEKAEDKAADVKDAAQKKADDVKEKAAEVKEDVQEKAEDVKEKSDKKPKKSTGRSQNKKSDSKKPANKAALPLEKPLEVKEPNFSEDIKNMDNTSIHSVEDPAFDGKGPAASTAKKASQGSTAPAATNDLLKPGKEDKKPAPKKK